MPALQTLLSRGHRESLSANFATTLCAHFGLQAEAGAELPLAALSALGDGLDVGDGWWLYADPVHMVADRDQLLLSASAALQLSQTEADTMVAELNRIYVDDGWHFVAVTPQRWYLRLPQPLVMRTTPTAEAMGRRVGEVLPQGGDAMSWQRVMTEVQMLLHTSPVNEARSEQGALAVNGLWFWGGGTLPQKGGGCGWERIVADDATTRGLARLHGVAAEEPSSTAVKGLSRSRDKVLWVDTALPSLQPMAEVFNRLEQQYFAPLLAMLQGGELSQLVIELPGQGCWTIDRKALRRWWRWRKPLASLLKE
jgi:hypothetical protein